MCMKVEWTVCVRAVENIFALFAIKSNGNLLSKFHVTVPSARHRTAEEQVKTFNSPTMKYKHNNSCRKFIVIWRLALSFFTMFFYLFFFSRKNLKSVP